MLAFLGDPPKWSVVDEITLPAIHFLSAHPSILLVFSTGTLGAHLLRLKFPLYRTRPKWARYLLGVFDISAGNLWRVILWATARIGLVLKGPQLEDDPDPAPAPAPAPPKVNG